jgi:hypothetical protein
MPTVNLDALPADPPVAGKEPKKELTPERIAKFRTAADMLEKMYAITTVDMVTKLRDEMIDKARTMESVSNRVRENVVQIFEKMTEIMRYRRVGAAEALREIRTDTNLYERIKHTGIGIPRIHEMAGQVDADIEALFSGNVDNNLAEFQNPATRAGVKLNGDHFFRELCAVYTSPDFLDLRVVLPGDQEFAKGTSKGNRWDGMPRLVAVTRSITINDQDGDPVEFPPWQLEFPLDSKAAGLRDLAEADMTYSVRLSVAAGREPNTRRGGTMWHPHVQQGGQVCGGTAAGPGNVSLRNGQISDTFFVFFQLLSSYNHEGDFNDLRHWSPTKVRCSACNGRIKPGEDRVVINDGRMTLHKTCAVEYEGHYYHPRDMYRCPLCGSAGPTGPTRRIFNGNLCCVKCVDGFKQEAEAAAAGEYLCHSCRTKFPRDQAVNAQVPVRNGWTFCTSCLTPTDAVGDAGEKMFRFQANGNLLSTLAPQFRNNRPTPKIREAVMCACGAWAPKEEVRDDFFRIAKCCPVCDPGGLQFSQAFLRDVAYLEGWIQNFWAMLLDDVTKEYVTPMSFLANETPLAEAVEIVKRLRLVELGQLNMPPIMQLFLKEYCAAVNQLIDGVSRQPLLVLTASTEEEAFYNAEIHKRTGRDVRDADRAPGNDTVGVDLAAVVNDDVHDPDDGGDGDPDADA